MECRTTSSEARRRQQSRAMTMVEMMVSTAIGTMVLAAVMSLTVYTARSFQSISNYMDLDVQSRYAIDYMSRKIRECSGVTAFASDAVTLDYKGRTLIFQFDDANDQLVEHLVSGSTTNTTVLLEDCESLVFELYQRWSKAGTFEQYSFNQTNNVAKMIRFNWTCKKSTINMSQTEELQTAKVVIRNQ